MVAVRDLAVSVLRESARSSRFADELLEPARAKLADRRDRALLTALVNGALRHRLTLDRMLAMAAGRDALDPDLADVLRVAAFQILFLTRIPAAAAVNEAVESARRARPKAAGFANAVLRNLQREIGGPHLLPRPGLEPLGLKRVPWGSDPVERLSAAYSHPDWLVRRWLGHGWPLERVEAVCAADNLPPIVQVRGVRDDAAELLRQAGVPFEPLADGAAAVSGAGDLADLEPFRLGRLRVQDETAARVAPLVGPSAGERVLDVCAAPGGKTVHLAAMGARVVATDLTAEKVARIVDSVKGLEPGRVAVAVADGRRPPWKGAFDAVLLDVPCSNTAVLGRRADARWRISPSDFAALAPLQSALLESAARLVRPGGRLVYSTCSLELDENERRVGEFLARHPEYASGPVLHADPAGGGGGGFAARLDRRA